MTLTRREKIMIIAGLIIVSLAAYIMYFLLPYLENTNQARQKLASAQSRLSILNAQANNIDSIKGDIATLEKSLEEQGATIAKGMDHARILLYLEGLTKGRAVDVDITVPTDQMAQSRFQTQSVAMDFRTTWPVYVEIMEDLKKNELYHHVAYLKAEYREQEANQAQETPDATEPAAGSAAPTLAPGIDNNVITVHLELVYYAFDLPEGGQLAQPLPPSVSDRKDTLFPGK